MSNENTSGPLAAERERCARICDEWARKGDEGKNCADLCADEIRSGAKPASSPDYQLWLSLRYPAGAPKEPDWSDVETAFRAGSYA